MSLLPLTACTRAGAAAGTPPTHVSQVAAPISPVVADRRTTGGIVPSDVPRAPDAICQISIDDTDSVDPTARDRALHALADSLPAFLDAFACHELRISHFTNQGAFAPVTAVLVPPASAAVRCADITPTGTRGVPIVFFDHFRDYYAKQGEATCQQQQQQAAIALDAERERFLQTARAALLRARMATGDCTALLPIVEHALDGPGKRVLVLLSDAASTCERRRGPLHLGADARVLLVLVPSVGPITARGLEALARADAWQHLLPRLTVVLFHDLAPWRWPDLAHPATPVNSPPTDRPSSGTGEDGVLHHRRIPLVQRPSSRGRRLGHVC